MKKVGIVTIFDLNNYGNRLQNYAMEQIFRKNNVDVDTIVLPQYNEMFKYNHKISHFVKKLYSIVKKDNFTVSRYLNFLKFQKNMKAVVADPKDIEDRYDLFVTGSDQVWHPEVVNDDFLLQFTSNNKRAAVSPSFGVSVIPRDLESYYKQGIEKMKFVSVREESGKRIINGITNSDVEILLDPVFMLDKQEWDKVESKVKDVPSKYIVKYLLGEKKSETEEHINRIAKENGLKIIDVYNNTDNYFSMGPGEFVSLIKNAELVCTNSFHALVFSLIYEKNFVAFNRYENGNDMNSRVEHLLKKFKMEKRKIEKLDYNIFDCDFTESNIVLQSEREKFAKYINKILE